MIQLSRQLAVTVIGLAAQQSALRVPELRSPLCSNRHLHPTVWESLMRSQRSVADHTALCGRELTPDQIAYVIAHEKRVGPLTALAEHNVLPAEVYRSMLDTKVAASIAQTSLAAGKIPAELIDAYFPLALGPASLEVVEHPVGDTITAQKLFAYANRFRIDTHSIYTFTNLVERRPDIVPYVTQSPRAAWWTVLCRTRHIAGQLPALEAWLQITDAGRNLAQLTDLVRALQLNPWVSADEYQSILRNRCFLGLHMQSVAKHVRGDGWVAPDRTLEAMTAPDELTATATFIVESRRFWEYGSILDRPLPPAAVALIAAEVRRSLGGRISARSAKTIARLTELGEKFEAPRGAAFAGDEYSNVAEVHATVLERFIPDDTASWELVFGLVDGFHGDVQQFLTNVEALRA
jgi:hypothetical protein